MVAVKKGDKWILYSKNGKKLGTFDRKSDLVEREKEIQRIKHAKKNS